MGLMDPGTARFGRIYDADLVPVGSVFQINTTSSGDQVDEQVTALADGGFVATWVNYDPAVGTTIMAQRFDEAGSKVGSEVDLSDFVGASFRPDVIQLADGSLVFAWSVGGDIEQKIVPLDELQFVGQLVVHENEPGVVIGAVSANDPDGDTSFSYAISDSRFEVIGGQLKLKDGVSLEYDLEQSVSIDVTVTDDGGLARTETFVVYVIGGQQNQVPIAQPGSASGPEDSAIVGQLAASDGDGDTLVFELAEAPQHGFVMVNQDGSYSYMPDENFSGTDSFTYQVSDGKGGLSSGTVALTIFALNDAPSDITPTSAAVDENATGALVAAFTANDPEGDLVTWSTLDSRFEFVDNTLKLKEGVSLDYEADSSFDIGVRASDASGDFTDQTVTINVNDIEEAGNFVTHDGNRRCDRHGLE